MFIYLFSCFIYADRHSKAVFELNAQQKLLAPDADVVLVSSSVLPAHRPLKPSSSVAASSSSTSVKRAVTSSKATTSAVRVTKVNGGTSDCPTKNPVVITAEGKPVRRVLPEHEGRYKITLPAGTTQRSKEILLKKAMRRC